IVIVGNGEDWQREKVLSYCQRADFIIAADNGLSLLHKLDIVPDLIMGDLDSVSTNLLEQFDRTPIEKFSAKKDYSDLELSIKKAISMNPREIILLAVTGTYFDHSYAAIINLFRNDKSDIELKIVTSNSLIFSIKKKTILRKLKGRRFSLFPLGSIKNFSMKGAQYQFCQNNLKFTDYSLSNVIIADELEINLDEGMLFCVLFDKSFS
ncbi:MAG TPA: thiamine diphosphokinase, partial [Atribacterota bacterium]|nr:thiamine diphosphokinase [Atribacterota bacterium]